MENKVLALVINTSKFTARFTERMLQKAITAYLRRHHQNGQNDVVPRGKQTVKQLIGQNQGVTNIEVEDSSTRQFDRIARKYGVDYAIRRDKSADPPKFLVFFKSRDADALTAAFKEYAGRNVRRASRQSVLQRLREVVPHVSDKIRKKVPER